MIVILRKEKAAWLDKVPSGLCGKPDNNLFGQCITVYGKQTGRVAASGRRVALTLILTGQEPCQSALMCGTPMCVMGFFKCAKKQGPLHVKPRCDNAT